MILHFFSYIHIYICNFIFFFVYFIFFFFVKQKPAYEMRISGWSSDVCSSDLIDLDLETPGLGPAPLPSGLGFLDVVARHAIGLSGGESWAGSLGRSAGQPGRICLISRLPYFAAVCWMRICRARVRIASSRSLPSVGSTGASIHCPVAVRSWRNTLARMPSERSARSRMYTVILNRSPRDCGGTYQSVMITPPKGSAEDSGMKDRVSSEARHRKALTATPPPPVAAAAGWSPPSENRSIPPGPVSFSWVSYVGLLPGPDLG